MPVSTARAARRSARKAATERSKTTRHAIVVAIGRLPAVHVGHAELQLAGQPLVARTLSHLVEAVTELRLAVQRHCDRHDRPDDGEQDRRVELPRIVIRRPRPLDGRVGEPPAKFGTPRSRSDRDETRRTHQALMRKGRSSSRGPRRSGSEGYRGPAAGSADLARRRKRRRVKARSRGAGGPPSAPARVTAGPPSAAQAR